MNTLAICLGGTLNTMMLAYLEAVGDRFVNVTTLLNSATDYSQSGLLSDVFTDPGTIEVMCRRMEETGYLEAKDMTRTFTMLRANDLLFRYVVDNWLLGENPPAFDLLAWNDDGTRMPGKAHSYFARKMYIENALANDKMEALGERLIMSSITTDTYIVAAVDDHIVPWQSSYKSTQLYKGPIRFVLTSSGHIAGIVNPPSPKVRLWTNDNLPEDPARWLADATQHAESWWEDWSRWISGRAGRAASRPRAWEAPPTRRSPTRRVRMSGAEPEPAAARAPVCVRVGVHTIRVSVRGSLGVPLLLVNGIGAPIETWDTFRDALGDRLTVAFDAPGTGGSSTPMRPLTIREVAGIARQLVEQLGYVAFDVLGYSFGGAVAQELARVAPDRVRRLVLAATNCGWAGRLAAKYMPVRPPMDSPISTSGARPRWSTTPVMSPNVATGP